jgi:hypothetical protein
VQDQILYRFIGRIGFINYNPIFQSDYFEQTVKGKPILMIWLCLELSSRYKTAQIMRFLKVQNIVKTVKWISPSVSAWSNHLRQWNVFLETHCQSCLCWVFLLLLLFWLIVTACPCLFFFQSNKYRLEC